MPVSPIRKTRTHCIAWLLGIVMSLGSANVSANSTASGAIDAKTFEVLTKAQELTEKDKFTEALKALDSVKDSSKIRNNSYAKSQMWNFYAYIYASQELFREAIAAYRKVIAEKDAPDGLKLQAKYTTAQLYFQMEDYDSVIKFMEEWLATSAKPTATAHIMLAQAYYEKKRFNKALENLDLAIQLNTAEGKQKINENWLRMKIAIYYETNNMERTLATYRELFALYPKIDYLKQIAGLYGETGKTKERLTTYDAVYLHGSLQKESEVLNLAYMYLGQGAPYKAGRIIEEGIKTGVITESANNLETLANAWAQANEHTKAIPVLQQIADMSDKGLLYARLAGVYFDAGKFEQAAIAARHADNKGGLKQRSGNQMLLGMALFNTKDYEGALQAFRQAKKSKKNFSDARQWEKYTLGELARLRAIEKSKIRLVTETEKAITANESTVQEFGKNVLSGPQSETVKPPQSVGN